MSIILNGEACTPSQLQTRINSITDHYINLHIPSGQWRFENSIQFPNKPVSIIGEGWSSCIEWVGADGLFKWNTECTSSLFRDFEIKAMSGNERNSEEISAFKFSNGITQTNFSNIRVAPDVAPTYDYDQNCWVSAPLQSCIWVDGNQNDRMDSVFINGCQFWYLVGTGIRTHWGSEVRISNCRILGPQATAAYSRPPVGSHGVRITGNMGGIHMDSTDIAGLDYGVRIYQEGELDRNREVFISQSTLDVCNRGLAVEDSSYVSVTGCWAASCFSDNIWVKEGGINPVLNISGGTIFNAGVQVQGPGTGMHGITINSGSFCLTGIHIRNNRGNGLYIPALENTNGGAIVGCVFEDNITNSQVFGPSSSLTQSGNKPEIQVIT